MGASHFGKPFVHVPLAGPEQCTALAGTATRLIDGCLLPARERTKEVRGLLVVTDPIGRFGRAVAGTGAESWLGRQLWLADGEWKHGVKPPAGETPPVRLDAVPLRYRNAMNMAWGERLYLLDSLGTAMDLDFSGGQEAWVSILGGFESSYPGITAILRPLAMSLLCGMVRILGAGPLPQGLEHRPGALNSVAFALWLTHRMLRMRRRWLADSRRRELEALARRMALKLTDGPMTVRELTRRFHQLSTGDCEEALGLMRERGRAVCDGRLWSLAAGRPDERANQPEVIDV